MELPELPPIQCAAGSQTRAMQAGAYGTTFKEALTLMVIQEQSCMSASSTEGFLKHRSDSQLLSQGLA